MSPRVPDRDPAALVEAVRAACLRAALDAYEDAGLQGVCAEGRWEAAVAALRRVDLDPLVRGAAATPVAPPDADAPRAP